MKLSGRPGIFMRNENVRKREAPAGTWELGRMQLKITHDGDYLLVEIGSFENLPGETEAAVFVMDDLDEKKRTLYMQKGKFAEKLESGTNNRTFMFKIGIEEVKTKKLVVMIEESNSCFMEDCVYGVRINLRYVEYQFGDFVWFHLLSADWDSYPASVPISKLAEYYQKFKPKNLNDEKPKLSPDKKIEIQKMFSKMDPNGNGYVEQPEFAEYMRNYGIHIDEERSLYLFHLIQSLNAESKEKGSSHNGITLQDLMFLFEHEDEDDGIETPVDLIEMKDIDNLYAAMQSKDVTINEEDLVQISNMKEDDDVFRATMRNLLRRQSVEETDLKKVVEERWKPFAGFERKVDDKIVMQGTEGIVGDVLPGNISLGELSKFGDLPELLPKTLNKSNKVFPVGILSAFHKMKAPVKFTCVKGVQNIGGDLIFPQDFPGNIQTDIATPETVGYYGARISGTTKTENTEIFIETRHAIQDFTYEDDYFQKWVEGGAGGPGLESHSFHHIDMPIQKDAGYYVLAKFVDDEKTEIHITAYKVPEQNTIFTPGGVLHTNNYQKGTWRIMLSEGPVEEMKLKRGGKSFGFIIG